MLGQDYYTDIFGELGPGAVLPTTVDYEATQRAIAASQAGEGGTGGGAGQGQPGAAVVASPDTSSGVMQALSDAASSVLSVVEAPFKAVGGVLTGIQTTGQYLPVILFGLGAVALFVLLPRSGRGTR